MQTFDLMKLRLWEIFLQQKMVLKVIEIWKDIKNPVNLKQKKTKTSHLIQNFKQNLTLFWTVRKVICSLNINVKTNFFHENTKMASKKNYLHP